MKNYIKGIIVRSSTGIGVLLLAILLLLFLNKGPQEQILDTIGTLTAGIVIFIIVLIKAVITYRKLDKYDKVRKYEEV